MLKWWREVTCSRTTLVMYLRDHKYCASFVEHVILLKVVFTYIYFILLISPQLQSGNEKDYCKLKGPKWYMREWRGPGQRLASCPFHVEMFRLEMSPLTYHCPLVFIQIFLERPYNLPVLHQPAIFIQFGERIFKVVVFFMNRPSDEI
jgi:hypothetical protein